MHAPLLDNELTGLICCRARFGPNGIRQGSRRLGVERINVPYNVRLSENMTIVDCGDVRA